MKPTFMPRARTVTALLAAGSAALTGAGPVASGDATSPSTLLLPELKVSLPTELGLAAVRRDGRARVELGFRSSVENVGAGAFEIVGSRSSRRAAAMHAQQRIALAGGGFAIRNGAGTLRYDRGRGHHHWHFGPFMRYELRTADRAFRRVARDRKQGFCLGDRFAGTAFVLGVSEPVFQSFCGRHQPRLLRVDEGISVGFGDAYSPLKEGQDIDITSVPNGRYYLVNRLILARGVLEQSSRDGAAALLVGIRWRQTSATARRVRVKVIASCPQAPPECVPVRHGAVVVQVVGDP